MATNAKSYHFHQDFFVQNRNEQITSQKIEQKHLILQNHKVAALGKRRI
jgi:hypothetical protein